MKTYTLVSPTYRVVVYKGEGAAQELIFPEQNTGGLLSKSLISNVTSVKELLLTGLPSLSVPSEEASLNKAVLFYCKKKPKLSMIQFKLKYCLF